MVVPPHRDGGQAQFVQAPVRPCSDESLGSALVWAAEHLHTDIDVAGRRVLLRNPDGNESFLEYDELVVGTGALPVLPPIEGLSGWAT